MGLNVILFLAGFMRAAAQGAETQLRVCVCFTQHTHTTHTCSHIHAHQQCTHTRAHLLSSLYLLVYTTAPRDAGIFPAPDVIQPGSELCVREPCITTGNGLDTPPPSRLRPLLSRDLPP